MDFKVGDEVEGINSSTQGSLDRLGFKAPLIITNLSEDHRVYLEKHRGYHDWVHASILKLKEYTENDIVPQVIKIK